MFESPSLQVKAWKTCFHIVHIVHNRVREAERAWLPSLFPPASMHAQLCRVINPSEMDFLGSPSGKEAACQCRRPETWVPSPGGEDPLEEGMATYCSILAWRVPKDRGGWRATVHGVSKSHHDWSDLAWQRTNSGQTRSEKTSEPRRCPVFVGFSLPPIKTINFPFMC